MNKLIIDIKEIILQLFCSLHKRDRNREDYPNAIRACLQSAADRILYFDKVKTNNCWRMLDDSSYRQLHFILSKFFIEYQQTNGVFLSNEKTTIKVDVIGTMAVFTFEKVSTE